MTSRPREIVMRPSRGSKRCGTQFGTVTNQKAWSTYSMCRSSSTIFYPYNKTLLIHAMQNDEKNRPCVVACDWSSMKRTTCHSNSCLPEDRTPDGNAVCYELEGEASPPEAVFCGGDHCAPSKGKLIPGYPMNRIRKRWTQQ